MSEIFDWRKRGRRDKGNDPPIMVDNPAEPHSNEAETKDRATDNPNQEDRPSVARLFLPGTSTFDLQSAATPLKTIIESHTIAGEQYRLLRAKLNLLQKQRGFKILLICSAVPNEGKTLAACGLAAVLAQEPGKRVLLIEADLRKPDSFRKLGIPNNGDHAGNLSRVLRGETALEDALLQQTDGDLYFLPAGPVPANPSELLTSPNLEHALKGARELFDWILIDSPPVLPIADASQIAPLCDTALLVVSANRTPVNLVKSAIKMLGREKICGVVLNRVRQMDSSVYRSYYRQRVD